MITLPASVERITKDYLSRLAVAMPGNITGVYLTGSVALGDYYSNKSDIDFITVVDKAPGKESLAQLRKLHQYIERTHHHPKLNGYYITLAGLQDSHPSFPSFFTGRMHASRPFELKQFSLFELKFYSHHVYGTPVTDLSIDVAARDVITELHQNINTYWTTWIQKYSAPGLNRIFLTLFPRLSEWGLLGVARQLYTLETGSVTSKLGAGRYYVDKLPAEHRAAMQSAIETRTRNKTQIRPSLKRAAATISCMKWIVAEFNRMYEESRGVDLTAAHGR